MAAADAAAVTEARVQKQLNVCKVEADKHVHQMEQLVKGQAAPDLHPSSRSCLSEMGVGEERKLHYTQLQRAVQRHQCRSNYCLRGGNGRDGEDGKVCRFGCPHTLHRTTKVAFTEAKDVST